MAGAFQTSAVPVRDSERFQVLVLIASQQASLGNWLAAEQTAATIQDPAARDHALFWIADARGRAKDFQGALATGRRVGPEWQMDVFRRTAVRQQRERDTAGAVSTLREAFQLLRKAVEDAENAESRLGFSRHLVTIAAAQRQGGDLTGAATTSEYLRHLLEKNSGAANMESTLHAIAWTQAEVGDIEAGLVTAQQTQVGSSRDLILALIARAQAQAGAVTSARETAATITDRTWHPWALWQIGTVQIHAGNVWDGMETIAGIPDPVARAKALLWAALTPAASGDRVTAAILLDQALTEISSIDGKNVDPEVFQRACVIRAQTGDLWGGLRMARGIEDE
ncbi:MAG: hypothetical protein L0212_03895, partial [Acidobacteria bacterium]|nr:hypothetical protein [Acidobacteriota bacterium]